MSACIQLRKKVETNYFAEPGWLSRYSDQAMGWITEETKTMRFFPPQRPDWLSGSSHFLSNGQWGSFPGGEVVVALS